jgi:transposase InsO family protein
VAFVKLYDRKDALVAADMLNDRVLPFFEEQGVPLLRVLTDRGTEYCGNREHHEYQLYFAVENIDHSRTKAYSPQTNGICERFHRTMQDEFYSMAFESGCMRLSRNFSRMWTLGSRSTMNSVRIPESTALGRRRCRPS